MCSAVTPYWMFDVERTSKKWGNGILHQILHEITKSRLAKMTSVPEANCKSALSSLLHLVRKWEFLPRMVSRDLLLSAKASRPYQAGPRSWQEWVATFRHYLIHFWQCKISGVSATCPQVCWHRRLQRDWNISFSPNSRIRSPFQFSSKSFSYFQTVPVLTRPISLYSCSIDCYEMDKENL